MPAGRELARRNIPSAEKIVDKRYCEGAEHLRHGRILYNEW